MREGFKTIYFRQATKDMIARASAIIEELRAQGYTLTLRQLFYQLVSRDIIKNTFKEYKRLGETLNKARLAGLIDWDAIEDRTRILKGLNTWESPESIIEGSAAGYRINKWERQKTRVEVWVEKDALVDVVRKACNPLGVDYFSCRGYTSQTAVYWASKRLMRYMSDGKEAVIIHLGDHDPSGVDMTRDIADRFQMFTGYELAIERIALNMNQIEQYDPPPNFAKESDSRYKRYARQFGKDCWELDALDPRVIDDLISNTIKTYRDEEIWKEDEEREAEEKALLQKTSDRWDEVVKFLAKPPRKPKKGKTNSKKRRKR